MTADVVLAAGCVLLLAGLLLLWRQASVLKIRHLQEVKDRKAQQELLEDRLRAVHAESAERQAANDKRLSELCREVPAIETRVMGELQKLQCGLDERLGSFVAGYDELVRVEIAVQIAELSEPLHETDESSGGNK